MRSRLTSCVVFLLTLLACASPWARAQLVPPDTTEGAVQINYDDAPFANYSSGDGGAGFVKFALMLSDPATVYFQDSNLYPFHYDFAKTRLQPFLGFSRTQFDAAALRRAGQQVVLGAVILPPFGSAREYGIQFVGLDPYPKEDVKAWFESVKASVLAMPVDAKAVYIPSFEQKEQAEIDRAWLAERGIEVDSIERWVKSNAIYADGWAFGRLNFVPGAQIQDAYAAGTLLPTDVLLTDGVPAEVPFVAGILTLSAATPNSHVAILARNQRVPFAWLSREAERTRVQALVGREVLVRAQATGQFDLRVSAADEDLNPKVRAQILKMKEPPKVEIKARKLYGALAADTANLTPRDIKFFGGKAANFGLLRRTIPQNSPKAIAFSFDLWNQFLGNVNPDSGLTLREEIALRLGDFTYPPNMPQASEALDDVRGLIRKKVKFTDGQKAAILAELAKAGFTPTKMLRFRSSSNAEDNVHLSGAGLYESFSGCIADSTDNDEIGPCRCASDEPDEKTILKAVEKVFASFYNDNAWLERLRFGITENAAGMAILVHENAPDADEMANGVATINRTRFSNSVEFQYTFVTQLGAVSVTNPEGGAKPEIVSGGQSGPQSSPYVQTQQHSDLVQLGANVMAWETDYQDLAGLLVKVAQGYARLFPEKDSFTLDLEFKKLQPGVLQVKQVRELLEPKQQLVPPILLNEPKEFVVLQSEFADAFALHRLKSVIAAQTRNAKLIGPAIQQPLHLNTSIEFIHNGLRDQLSNGTQGFPGFRFTAKPGAQTEQWRQGVGDERVVYKLKSTYPKLVDAAACPVITQSDFSLTLTALYKTPQPTLGELRTSDSTRLILRDQYLPEETPQTRRIQTAGGVTIDPQFYWPNLSALGGFVIIKTLPLVAWEKTTITGLISTPLVLTDDFAQTYAPGHHNFSEVFLFEPALDPAVTEAQRQELITADIRYIYVNHHRFEDSAVSVIGFDGVARVLP